VNNKVAESGDKAISVGEESQDVIFNNLLVGNNTGMAIKDSSTPMIVNNTIIENRIGIAIYRKKAAHAGGQAKIFNSLLQNLDMDIGIQNEEGGDSLAMAAHSFWIDRPGDFKYMIVAPEIPKIQGKKGRFRNFLEGEEPTQLSPGKFVVLRGNGTRDLGGRVTESPLFMDSSGEDFRVSGPLQKAGDPQILNRIVLEHRLLEFGGKKTEVPIGIIDPFPFIGGNPAWMER